MRILVNLLAAITLLVAAPAAHAQVRFVLVTDSGSWTATPRGSSRGQLTAAQERVLNDKINAIVDVFRAAKPIAPPHGYKVAMAASMCVEYSCPKGAPATAELSVIMRPYLRNTSTGVISKVALKYDGAGMDVEINRPRIAWRAYDRQDQLYIEPTVTGHVAGYPVYEHRYLVLTKNRRPLYIPMSEEQFIRNCIAKEKSTLTDTRETIAKGSPLQQWLESSKAGRAGFMEGNAIVARTDPAKARQQRDEYERGMAETERMLRAQEAANTGAITGAATQESSTLAALQAELDGLSAEERSAPAYLPTGRNSSTRASGLMSRPDGDNTQMLIQPNPQFFDSTLPPTAVQIIAIDLPGVRDDLPGNAEDSLLVAVRGALDYGRLAALLDGPQ